METPVNERKPGKPGLAWPGLGGWNLYFLAKFILVWLGYLNFQAVPNLVFAAALLLPVSSALLLPRKLLALPAGVALLYHDTWLPPFARLLAQPGVLNFSAEYLLELAGRFIDWTLVGVLFVFVVAALYLSRWLRLTTFTLVGLGWLASGGLPDMAGQPAVAAVAREQPRHAVPASPGREADSATLDEYLQRFYGDEAGRRTEFQPPPAAAAPFDLLLVNICSLAWDDLEAVGMKDNTLFRQMDIVFDHFNSATSYSGPAAIRLLRASCGQSSHSGLYDHAANQCLLFDNLRRLGFDSALALNHDGKFDDFLGEVRRQGGMPAPALDGSSFRRALVNFDGSPIWRDREVLERWWQHRQGQDSGRVALLYNTVTLHDGNRLVRADGGTQRVDYRALAQRLLEDLNAFIDQLERSGRRVVLVIVPEHGAGLHGDRMQIAGMREIPSPSITHVPVGIKLIGMGSAARDEPLHVGAPSSYLALSEIIARLSVMSPVDDGAGIDRHALVADLPQTAPVAENAGTVVLEYGGMSYVRIQEQGEWLPYPHRSQ